MSERVWVKADVWAVARTKRREAIAMFLLRLATRFLAPWISVCLLDNKRAEEPDFALEMRMLNPWRALAAAHCDQERARQRWERERQK